AFLPRQLGRAEEMLCGMMQNGYGSQSGNSVFLYGRADMPTTIDAIVLTRYRNSTIYSKASSVKHNPDDVVIEERSSGYGDGTVLEDVAGAVGMVDPLQAHMSQMVHASLPDDPSFRKQLDWTIQRTKAAQVQRAASKPDGRKRVMKYLALNRVRLPDGGSAVFAGGDAVADWASATNLEAFPGMRPEPADRGWTANNRGHALIADRDFTSAEIVMRAAAEKLLAEPRKDRQLAAKLLNNYGWALLRLGRFDAAEKTLRSARAAGNWKARVGLAEIARQRSAMKKFGRAALLLEDVQ
ncbi:MAG: tetratricopeptide repeat protein, partial [Rhizobiales bacterium]|nr:tetratricopeptide repeat protein [Hyphomicrobiales bacterium]